MSKQLIYDCAFALCPNADIYNRLNVWVCPFVLACVRACMLSVCVCVSTTTRAHWIQNGYDRRRHGFISFTARSGNSPVVLYVKLHGRIKTRGLFDYIRAITYSNQAENWRHASGKLPATTSYCLLHKQIVLNEENQAVKGNTLLSSSVV